MFADGGLAGLVSTGRAAGHNLAVIFPQICWWEEWSPAPSALAHWLCWHGAQAEPTPHSFSQAEGSVIHHSQNPTSHSSQTFTPRRPPPHLLPLASPPKRGLRWHAKGTLPSPSITVPNIPPAVFRLFQARGLQTRSIRPFSCDGTLRRNVHFLKARQLWRWWNLRNPATERRQWKMPPLFEGI